MDSVEGQDYSKACSKYFSHKHPWYPSVTVYHPNQFYSESRKAFNMSNLTPPPSGRQVSEEPLEAKMETSLFDNTVNSAADESLFEMEDDFDKSVASMYSDQCSGDAIDASA